MSDKAFFDSNIFIYAFSKQDIKKGDIALALLKDSEPIVSTQVLSECANVFIKKGSWSFGKAKKALDSIKKFCNVVIVNEELIDFALKLAEKYGYSYYDSQILAVGISAKCEILYSEDMQDGQIVEGLKIVNPFKR